MSWEDLDCDRNAMQFLDRLGRTSPVVKTFPAVEVCRAIAACKKVAGDLDVDRETRREMIADVTKSWEGGAREVFDTMCQVQHERLSDLIDLLKTLAGELHDAWDAADSENMQLYDDNHDPREIP